MKHLTLLLLSLILFYSCREKNNYVNPSYIELLKGDSTPVFISTNSCCNYCIPSFSVSHKLKRTSTEIIKEVHKQCAGCSNIHLNYYRALDYGKDSIIIKTISPLNSCDSNTSEVYNTEIIHITIK